MEIVIIVVIALVILLIISGKRSSDKRLDSLVSVLESMEESSVRYLGSMKLGLNSSTPKTEVIKHIKKEWGLLKQKQQELLTLEIMIIKTSDDGDEKRSKELFERKFELENRF
jgi:cell shape-determining protein MreC